MSQMINEMNKEQLREHMTQTGEIHRASSESFAWKRAFELARLAGHGNLDMDCMRCWDKVVRFIKNEIEK